MKDEDSTADRSGANGYSVPNDDSLSLKWLRIDQIDKGILALLAERGDLAYEIARQLGELRKPYFEPARDQEKMLALHEQWNEHQNSKFPRQGLNYVFREILGVCASINKPLRIAYMGPPGTFSPPSGHSGLWLCPTAN